MVNPSDVNRGMRISLSPDGGNARPELETLEPRVLLSGSELSLGMDWSNYLGGSASEACLGVAVDGEGATYVTGSTSSSQLGNVAFVNAGLSDAFVAKFDSAGVLEYVTTIGGARDETGQAIVVDDAGSAYVAGQTRSSGLATPGDPTADGLVYRGAADGLFAKLDPTGQVEYVRYIGGGGDDWASDLAVDSLGRVYLTGVTYTSGLGDAPGTWGNDRHGDGDAFVARISADGNSRQYVKYIGGGASDSAFGIELSSEETSVFISGNARSSDLGAEAAAVYDYRNVHSLHDAFVARLAADGSELSYVAIVGGNDDDENVTLALDNQDNPHIAGRTLSTNLPVTNLTSLAGGTDIFAAKFSSNGQQLLYCTYLGGPGKEMVYNLDVDAADRLYVGGYSFSPGLATANAYDTQLGGTRDGIVAVLAADGNAVEYLTYYGGSGGLDVLMGLALSDTGDVHVAGLTDSSDLPTVQFPYSGGNDAIVAKFSPLLRAVDDAYTIDEDDVLNVPAPGVLANDGDPLTAELVSGPDHAAAFQLNADGSFIYTPAADFNGTDSFTYVATDGVLDSNEATVTITINPVNDAPVVVANGIVDVTVDEDAHDITVLDLSNVFDDADVTVGEASITFNDVSIPYPPGVPQLTVDDVTFATVDLYGNNKLYTSDSLDYLFLSVPGASGGNALIYGYGQTQMSIDFPSPVSAVSFLLLDSATVPFTVTGWDAGGGSLGDYAFTMPAAGVAVVQLPFADVKTIEIREDTYNGSITFLDDLRFDTLVAEPLTLSVTGNTNGDLVTATLAGTDLKLLYAADGNGSADITVRATDTAGDYVEDTFTVTVNPVNDAPSFTAGGNVMVDEDAGAQTIAAWATNISPGPADESSQTVDFIVTNDNQALFAVQPAIAFDGTLMFTPADDANGSATVTVLLHDDGGTANGGEDTSDPHMFTVTVNPVPDPPVITSLSATPAVIDEGESVELMGTFVDPDDGDEHTVIIDWGNGESETIVLPVGAREFAATHPYLDDDPSGTPSDDYTVTVTVADNAGESDTEAVAPAAEIYSDTGEVALNGTSPNPGDSLTTGGWIFDIGRTPNGFYMPDAAYEGGLGFRISDTWVINEVPFSIEGGTLRVNVRRSSGWSRVTLWCGDPRTSLSALTIMGPGSHVSGGAFEYQVHAEGYPTQIAAIPNVNISNTGWWTCTIEARENGTAVFAVDDGVTTGSVEVAHNITDPFAYIFIESNGGLADFDNIRLEGYHQSGPSVTVNNVAPTVEITGAPTSSPEGTPIELGSTVTDPGTLDTHTYVWSVTKDGNPYATGTDLTFAFTPDDNGDYQVTLTVTDDDTGEGTASVVIPVTNVAASIDTLSVTSPINENEIATLSGTYSDPGSADTFELDIDWDGDLVYDETVPVSGGSFSVLHPYLDDDPTGTPSDTFDIHVRLRDDDGGADADSASMTVNNVGPTASITGAPASSPEGTPIGLGSTVTDPGTADTHTYAWLVTKGGVEYATGTGAVIEFTPDDNGSYAATLTVTDDDTGEGIASVVILVTNVAPTVGADNDAVTVAEGQRAENTGTYSDPGDDTVTLGASAGEIVDNGDGTWHWRFDTTDGPDESQLVTITATDEDGDTGETTFQLIVLNVAPTLDDAAFQIAENSSNGAVVGTVTATDPGDDTLTYSIVGGSGAFAIDPVSGQITVADETQLDFETTPTFLLEVEVKDDDNGTDTAMVTIDLRNQASITGVVFVDVNANDLYEANEPGIDGVTIELLDENGDPVLDTESNPITAVTSDGGFYLLEDLDPDTYQLHEIQPTGVDDGAEIVGSLGGTITANDTMQLTLDRTDASDYVFAEVGQQVTSGDTATIGFWQNKHGQALIEQGGTALADWLTANFGNVFGDEFAGGDGGDVASFFKDQLFRQKSNKSAGPAKVDAQFMAVAFATYFTSSYLAGNVAADYGFNVTDTGIGTRIVNVGDSGAAFDVADGTDLTIMQLLLATNYFTDEPDALGGFAHIYDQDGSGDIDDIEVWLRQLANEIYSAINEQGDI